MTDQQLVLNAVKQPDVSRKQNALQKLFALWFDAFVYNQIWEDPRVDIEALELERRSRILTISSGGCNALNYLLESPLSVTAVDLNRHHVYLLDLKIAAAKFLPDHSSFFNFFGRGLHKENFQNYQRYIRPNLDEDVRKFWDSASFFGKLRGGSRIDYFTKGGLYEHSRNGYFLRFFHRLAPLLGSRPEKVLAAENREQQIELFEKHIAPFFDSRLIKFIGKLPVTMFGLGIPPQQYDELKKEISEGGTLIDIYRERVRKLAVDFPINENYFAWQAFARKYDIENRKALPDYLKETNFPLLRENIGKITTGIGSVTDVIKNAPKNSFDRFVFLDAQDWMNAEMIADLWSTIATRGGEGSRIIFRTAGASSPLEQNLPAELLRKFEYKAEISRELFARDRASIYGGFHLYVLK